MAQSLNFTNFFIGEPNNFRGGENCLNIYGYVTGTAGGFWNDAPCPELRGTMVEVEAFTPAWPANNMHVLHGSLYRLSTDLFGSSAAAGISVAAPLRESPLYYSHFSYYSGLCDRDSGVCCDVGGTEDRGRHVVLLLSIQALARARTSGCRSPPTPPPHSTSGQSPLSWGAPFPPHLRSGPQASQLFR